ncbi:MAG: non-ribosomal peptide synthetase, partial [Tumebacillaceae bacterium]
FEIWGSLLNGGRLVLMPPGAYTMEELTELVKREGVTTVWMTTALFHQLAETPLENMQGVRQLLTGGELMSIAHAEKVRQGLPNGCILNMYGPTENTTFSTFHPMPPADQMPKLMPIGRPIANTTLYVLDPQQKPVPIGVAGELYVGGEGLALGYLNRPDLTAEKFVDHPFLSNARLYRTGDIVRYLSNGDLEFLGRVDHQVKIRGYRIELGEIEAACQSHPAVRQAFAIAHEEQPGVKHVVVYLVPHEGSEAATGAELREFAQERLPHFMVPSAIIWVDDLPLNTNGKVDRKRLPAPSFQSHVVEYVAPRDAVEEVIAEIFAETLHVEKVGVYDNFYDLGGQSFLAIKIMSRLQAHLQMSLPLRLLFEAPTVAGLAKRVTQMFMEEMELLTDEEAEQMLQ